MPAVSATVSVVTLFRVYGMVGTPNSLSPLAMKQPCAPITPSATAGTEVSEGTN